MEERTKEFKKIGNEVIVTKINVEKIDKRGIAREIESINFDLEALKKDNEKIKEEYLVLMNDKKNLEDILKEIEAQEQKEFEETLKAVKTDEVGSFDLES